MVIQKSGHSAVIGLPNTGKSTLINSIIDKKVSITGRVPQTTRNIIKGIYTDKENQIIFLDTPGYHGKFKFKFNRLMGRMVDSVLSDADVVLFVVCSINPDNDKIINLFKEHQDLKVLLVINKTDLLKSRTKKIEEHYKDKFDWLAIQKVSGLKKKGLTKLIIAISTYLSPGPFYYPGWQKTDRDEGFQFAEILREKLFYCLKKEMPHKIFVLTDDLYRDEKKQLQMMHFIVLVEKDREKAIVLGKNGSLIKEAATQARKEIETMIKEKVFLSVSIKTRDKWRNDKFFIKNTIGLSEDIFLTL